MAMVIVLLPKIAELDKLNPQIASRLLGAFSRWQRLRPTLKQQAQAALQNCASNHCQTILLKL